MSTHASFTLFLVILLSLTLAGCGGGGGGSDVAAGAGDPGTEPDPGGGGGDPTPDPLLESELQALLATTNAAPPPPTPPLPAPLVSLGQMLFFDKVLSGNRNISCAGCHHPGGGTSDGLSVSFGQGATGIAPNRQLGTGAIIARNAPHLFNLGNQRFMFWDGRVERQPNGDFVTPEPALNGPNPTAANIAGALPTALAAQTIFPPTSRGEMRGAIGENELADATDNVEVWSRIMVRLVGSSNGTVGGIAAYRAMFAAAFPGVQQTDDFNMGHAGAAMGAFIESAFNLQNSPYDRYLRGETDVLADTAKRGALLYFGRADCSRCHGGPRLSDGRFHAVGVPQVGPGADAPLEDVGRFSATGNANDRYEFKTPGLRNTALTGPWMHDGAYTQLENVVRHYLNPRQSLVNYNPQQLIPLLQGSYDTDPTRQAARDQAISGIVRGGVNLNNVDVADLVAFLESLTDPAALTLETVIPPAVPSGLPVGN